MAQNSRSGPSAGNPLEDVTNALKNLTRTRSDEDEDSSQSGEEDNPEYFCVEDTFLSNDIKVTVEGIGSLQFPIQEEIVEKLVLNSSKAQFGRGEETVLDMDIRDTQMIPASKLNVEIDEEALSNALERIGSGLNIKRSGTLVPHLYNMLIYRPGQFFKMHSDSPKEKNMVATLVIVLPAAHKGGDLIIHHNNKQHVFFGSKNPNFVKCVAFYSDCQHEIKKVTEGTRVALTYNVILQPTSQIACGVAIDNCLNNAVSSYFSGNEHPKKLVFLLNHSYSQNNLKWELLKGTDRTAALSLYVVAKNQNRIPCLALARYKETCDSESETEVLDTETVLYFWVDDQNLKMVEKDIYVNEYEVSYTMETTDLFQPYKTEYSGPTGNAGETTDNWYQRACVVIWSNRWAFSTGFSLAVNELHQLTTSPGNENTIKEEIDKAASHFYNREFWNGEEVSNKLIDIASYINDPSMAIRILSNFPGELLNPNKIGRLLHLEKQFDEYTWNKIMNSWLKVHSWSVSADNALKFIKKYMTHPGKVDGSFIVNFLLQKAIAKFIATDHRPIKYSNPYYSWYGSSASKTSNTYMYDRIDDKVIELLLDLFKVCSDLKSTPSHEKLVQYVLTSNVFTPVSVAELFLKLKDKFTQNQFPFFKHIKDFALAKVTSQIPELANCRNNWYFDIKIPCECKFCSPVQAFFHSKTQQRVVVPAGKNNRRHIYSHLNPLTSYPIKFHTERTGNPFKIIIEKESNVPEDREKILKTLLDLKNKLEGAHIVSGDSEASGSFEEISNVDEHQAQNDVGSDETPIKRSRLNSE